MFNPSLQLKTTTALAYTLLLLVVSFALPASNTHAQETITGRDNCSSVSPDEMSDNVGDFDQVHVPVKDFEAEALLRAILGKTLAIENDTESARQYLRLLCQKELELDPNLQNAWAETIGRFVEETRNWITGAFNENPVFLTSPHIYTLLVNKNVTLTFLREVRDSNIGLDTRKAIIRSVLSASFENVFPYGDNLPEFAEDNLGVELSEDFFAAGGYPAYENLQRRSNYDIIQIAFNELQQRANTAIAIEETKLDWGRGFFSYEQCDLNVYSADLPENERRLDRRNCRIVTPGSTIQDLTSFVLGSALRQMELADEYEEFVAGNAIAVLNDALNFNGLDTDNSRTSENVSTEPVGPDEAASLVNIGAGENLQQIPAEFDFFIQETSEPIVEQIKEDLLCEGVNMMGGSNCDLDTIFQNIGSG